jgi:hypothetical protein
MAEPGEEQQIADSIKHTSLFEFLNIEQAYSAIEQSIND